MASPTQTIMFTAMARGIAIDKPTLPVSVLVSPRLAGAPTLDAFPDWLRWTKHLKDDGLKVTFAVIAKILLRSQSFGSLFALLVPA